MRLSAFIALASIAVSSSALAQSAGGITVIPQSGPSDNVQHTTAAGVNLGGPQAATAEVVTGQDSPTSQKIGQSAPVGAGSSSVAAVSGGAAVTSNGQTRPQAYVSASQGGSTTFRAVDVNTLNSGALPTVSSTVPK